MVVEHLIQIKTVDVVYPTAGRRFIFTNNLAISCVLTGDDPFNATVSAGATNTQTEIQQMDLLV